MTDPDSESVATASEVLFIGGSHDGEHYVVPDRSNSVSIPSRRSQRNQTLMSILTGHREEEVYQRCAIEGEAGIFTFFVPSTMSFDEAVAWLIAGYGVAVDGVVGSDGDSAAQQEVA